MKTIKQNIETWLLEIGELIKERMSQPLEVNQKTSLADVVTNVDKEVETLFKEKIAKDYPTHRVLGEEGIHQEKIDHLDGDVWIIDPIDGTLNFVKEKQNFAVMIAYYRNGVGELGFIYDVMSKELYAAQRGHGATKNGVVLPVVEDTDLKNSLLNISANTFFLDPVSFEDKLRASLGLRIVGSAALSFIRLINGQHGGYVCVFLNPWDYMAGLIFMKELGLVVTDFNGEPIQLLQKTTLLAATPTTHKEILDK
ncbi:inositol monophosphatase family protein [Carnobacteriaceae bacterium zg-ZUI240]|nr:inositol monophosphatase family protein [Carnobacteriaceae bacterium zg-ZUI240]